MKRHAVLLSLLLLPGAFGELAADQKAESAALRNALAASNWSWESVAGGRKSSEDLRFFRNGFAENVQSWTGRWEATGARTFVIENTKPGARCRGYKALLVFDESFAHFVGFDFNGKTVVEGFRRESVDPKRAPPEPKVK